MSKDIWHTGKEKATEDKLVFAQHKSLIRDKGVDWFIWEPQEFTDAIREDVIAWAYLDDLLALETKLERTRTALDILLLTINRLENQNYKDCAWHLRLAIAKIKAIGIADTALEQITELKQKDK